MRKVIEVVNTVSAARVKPFTRRCCSLSALAHFLIFYLVFCTGAFIGADDVQVSTENGGSVISQAKLRLHDAGYSDTAIHSVVTVLKEATRDGIPAQLLYGRVQEGAAKHVPAPRLMAVLERDIGYLQQARRSLTELENGPLLIADLARWQRGANMLAAGIETRELVELGRICAAVPEKFRPLSVLYVSLIKWGLEPATTISVAKTLVRSAIPASEYEGVSDLYRSARKFRISPEELSRRIIAQADRVADIEELERRILR